jgi:hypothetical protein
VDAPSYSAWGSRSECGRARFHLGHAVVIDVVGELEPAKDVEEGEDGLAYERPVT